MKFKNKLMFSVGVALSVINVGASANNWDFKSPKKYEGFFEVDLDKSKEMARYSVSQKDTGTLISFNNYSFPEDDIGLIDIIQYNTPVESITVYNGPKGMGKISLTHNQPISSFPRVKLIDGKKQNFNISFKPINIKERMASLEKQNEEKFKGKLITLDFQDIPVRSIFKFIADFSGENLVVSDSVQGTVTIKLKDVRWDKALDIIMKTRGFGKRVMGDVTLIAPISELNNAERAELLKQNEIESLIPLDSTYAKINYAKAEEIAEFLDNIKSGRGQITFDERTNFLMIEDIPSKIERMKNIIKQIDVKVEQVLIETRIVLANEQGSREIGFELSGANSSGDGSSVSAGSDFATGIGGGSISYIIPDSIIDNFTARLAAIEENGDSKTVAKPKLLTADKKEATVKTGSEIPYSTVSVNGQTRVEFKEAALSLKATPQITPDGNIIMDLVITQDSVGENTASGPAIDTTEIDTQVLVADGETIVIGGIFKTSELNTERGVPLLKSIPFLGRLFRYNSTETERFELLFFITPKLAFKE